MNDLYNLAQAVLYFLAFALALFSAIYMYWRFAELSSFGFKVLELRLDVGQKARRTKEKLQMQIAWMLPRWLVYWASMRLFSEATMGKYGNTDPSDVRVITCLKRWTKDNV